MQKENNVLTTVESVAFVIQSKKKKHEHHVCYSMHNFFE